RLRQHIGDAGALQHRTGRPAGDHPGTGGRRTEHDHTGGLLALHRVRDGSHHPRHAEEVLLGLLDALGDRRGHLLGLAVPDADGPVAVAHHDQCGEAEAAAALDDLGDTVDRHDPLEELVLVIALLATTIVPAATLPTAAATAALLGSTHRFVSFRRCQNPRPDSRALSVSAAIRPWYLLPARSRTTCSTPAAFARSARRAPTCLAFAVLSPSAARRSDSIVEAEATVRPAESSTTWA